MTDQEAAAAEPAIDEVAAHPPTQWQQVAAPSRTVWPSVVGIIASVLGGLGILGKLWGIIWIALMPWFMSHLPSSAQSQASMSGISGHIGLMILMNVIGLGFSVALLTCGIGLARRRYWSVSGIQWWAGLYLVESLATMIVTWAIQYQAMQAQTQSQTVQPLMVTGMMTGMMVVGIVTGLIFAWALPVFVLIWFRREAVKAEVEDWA